MMLHALCSYISSRGTGVSSTSFAASTADANWSRVLFLSVRTLESSVAVIYHRRPRMHAAMGSHYLAVYKAIHACYMPLARNPQKHAIDCMLNLVI